MWLKWWRHQSHSNDVVRGKWVWLMFWAIYRYNTKKNRRICYRAIFKLPETENRIDELPMFHFILLFLFILIEEMFWAILDYLNHIFNIKSLWRHYDVIFKKASKMTSFVNKNLPIYVLIQTLFLLSITKITYLFPIWVKKSKHIIYNWKMGPYLLEKRTSCWWCHQNVRNNYYVK